MYVRYLVIGGKQKGDEDSDENQRVVVNCLHLQWPNNSPSAIPE
jgi:hypothetical protein